MKIKFAKQVSQRRRAFTLIELLVVISIIAVLSAITMPVMKSVFKAKKINTARIELQMVESALESYKAKYGVYPPGNPANTVVNQLFYELSGVTNTFQNSIAGYQTLDGINFVSANSFSSTFGGVGGILNCSKGNGEDVVLAKNFLPGLKSTQVTSATNAGYPISYLATSVGGPDANYHPAYALGFGFEGNPFRYAYPGTNNPNGYDIWVQLVINSKTNLVCNWSSAAQINSPLP